MHPRSAYRIHSVSPSRKTEIIARRAAIFTGTIFLLFSLGRCGADILKHGADNARDETKTTQDQ